MKENIFIVLEGISGSGKSSVFSELLKSFNKHPEEIVFFKWNQIGTIKKALSFMQRNNIKLPSIYALLEWLGFLLGYHRLKRKCRNTSQIIVCDRYLYTGIVRERSNESKIQIGKLFLMLCKKPDVIIFMDTVPSVCQKRIRIRGKRLYCPNKKWKIHYGGEQELAYLAKNQHEYQSLFRELEVESGIPVFKIEKQEDKDLLINKINEIITKKGM